MSKRPLTPEEIEIAAKLKARIAALPGMTEDRVGEALGVSQGAVSHWTGARLPVPAGRAAKLAAILQFDDPSELSLAYREIVEGAPSRSAQPQGSQPVRLDPVIVRAVVRVLLRVYKRELGIDYSITDEPEMFAEMYERTVARDDPEGNLVWLGMRIRERTQQGASTNERSIGADDRRNGDGKARADQA